MGINYYTKYDNELMAIVSTRVYNADISINGLCIGDFRNLLLPVKWARKGSITLEVNTFRKLVWAEVLGSHVRTY